MGTILYELATQRVAFTGETLVQTVVNITSGRPQPMTDYRPDTPAAFAELIDRAISPDPERRITTIEELRSGLKSSLEQVLMRGRVPTSMSGMAPLLRPPTPPPGGRVPTPPPGGRIPTPVPGLEAITAAPGVSLSTSAAPGGGTVAATSSSSKSRTSIWIIASTALIAIAATVAVMFAMQ